LTGKTDPGTCGFPLVLSQHPGVTAQRPGALSQLHADLASQQQFPTEQSRSSLDVSSQQPLQEEEQKALGPEGELVHEEGP